ncbi:hypothetical protein ELQ88_08200 [Pseudomonas sp. MPC6]|nr:hypothetical protein ELQ88_08200 [Pseudomonas sp. MPC6]
MPAKVVNDNACLPGKRGAFRTFAGKPVPTESPHDLRRSCGLFYGRRTGMTSRTRIRPASG